jgi:energy-coupling factor transport system ATP-binding protein
MAAINVENLHWKYYASKDYALKGISLTVNKGEFVAITGPSGAGKTTLILSLTGIIPQRIPGKIQGEVKVLGRSTLTTDVTEVMRKVGVVFEDPEVQFVMGSVEDEVSLALEPLNLPSEELRRRVNQALRIAGLDESFLSRNPLQLSGGEKQRVAIASAVARQPEILILDEPTSDLDPMGKEEVIQAVENLRRETDSTIILVEQDPEIIQRFAERVVVLNNGRLVFDGEPEELYRNINHIESFSIRPPELYELSLRAGLGEPSLDRLVEMARSGMLNHEICKLPGSRGAPGGAKLQAINVTHTYSGGVRALEDVNAVFRAGELVALMGPNGSGKTTLAKILAGLLAPTSGKVLVDGVDVRALGRLELASKVGYVYQNPQHQLFCQTVFDEVAFGLRLRGAKTEEIREVVERTLRTFKLEGLGDEHPFFLSKGEKRRLALASIYALNPDILIVDEPTTGQDRAFSERLFQLLRELSLQGKGIVIITHSVELAAKYADRVVVLKKGRIIADGPPTEVLTNTSVTEEAKLKTPLLSQLCKISREHP